MVRVFLLLSIFVGAIACRTSQPIAPPSTVDESSGDQMPQLIGGIAGLQQHVNRRACRENDTGERVRVTVSFTVDENGNVVDPSIRQGLGPSCNAEAIRVMTEHARFIPGRQDGQVVAVKMSLQIVFR